MPIGEKLKVTCMGNCIKGKKKHQVIEEYRGVSFKIPNDIVDDWIDKNIYNESLDYSDEIDVNLSEYTSNDVDIQDDVNITDVNITLFYQVIECGGCGYISFRKAYAVGEDVEVEEEEIEEIEEIEDSFNEKIEDSSDEEIEDSSDEERITPKAERPKIETVDRKFYPERKENLWYPVDIPNSASAGVKMMYQNAIKAYNHDLLILSSAGFRAVIEGICKSSMQSNNLPMQDTSGRSLTLKGMINSLKNNGIINNKWYKILNGSKLIGNVAIHQISKPTITELEKLKQAVEYFIALTSGIDDLADRF